MLPRGARRHTPQSRVTFVRRRSAQLVLLAMVALAAVVAVVLLAGGEDDPSPPPPRPQAAVAPPPSVERLQSRPDLKPPALAVDDVPRRPGRRLIFVSPRMEDAKRDARTHQQGALAGDQLGRTVWFRPAPDGQPLTDVRVQRYRGKPVLTWWQGAASKYGVGRGEGVIVDRSYRTVATVQAGNGQTVDLHEFRLTEKGTALVTIYSRARRDLTPLGGKRNAQVTQGIVQEIDVESGRVLFEWESLDEIKLSESIHPLPKPPQTSWDYFHINSVDEDTDGNLLISARHTNAVYKIHRRTGEVLWRLGGKKSDFRMGPGTRFALQHDAQRVANGHLRVFDNGAKAKKDQRPSSVKVLRLDTRRMRATLVRRLRQPDGMWAESQGNAHTAGGGGVMVGWGSTGAFSWLDARGRVLFDAHLPAEYDSYRAYLAGWMGRPAARPAVQAKREDEQVTVWASWNGATGVSAWQMLAGNKPRALRPVGRPAPWTGLETTIVRATGARYVAVAALDAAGRRLRTSRVKRVGPVAPSG